MIKLDRGGAEMPRNFIYYILCIILIGIDQGIKFIVRLDLLEGMELDILSNYFKITYIENKGIAFGMMEGNSVFLIILPLVLLTLTYILWRRYRQEYKNLFSISIAMIISGGLSNLFDRFFLGSVTDYFYLKGFAIFNFADICITIGCLMLLISIWFLEKKE